MNKSSQGDLLEANDKPISTLLPLHSETPLQDQVKRSASGDSQRVERNGFYPNGFDIKRKTICTIAWPASTSPGAAF